MNNMKALREAAGMSQSAVAKALKTTQQTYQRWETGKSDPSIDALQNMALLFKVPLSRIIGTPDGHALGFEPNHYILNDDDTGFWGHLGIQLPGAENSIWYPVSAQAQNRLIQNLSDCEEGLIAHINTLDNRHLLVNVDALNRIRFLEDACDDPRDDHGWLNNQRILDDGVSGLPSILYEAMTALITEDDEKIDSLGEAIIKQAVALLPDLAGDRDKFTRALIETRIHMIDGITIRTIPDDESLVDLVRALEMDFSPMIEIRDENECIDLIRKDRVALVDIPLCLYRDAMALYCPEDEPGEA